MSAADGVSTLDGLSIAPLCYPFGHAVSVNGRFAAGISRLCNIPMGVRVAGLEATLASNPGLVEPYLGKLSLTQTNAFTSLNTAFLCDGIVIFIDRGVVLERPIEVTFASTGHTASSVSHPRLLIVAGTRGDATRSAVARPGCRGCGTRRLRCCRGARGSAAVSCPREP